LRSVGLLFAASLAAIFLFVVFSTPPRPAGPIDRGPTVSLALPAPARPTPPIVAPTLPATGESPATAPLLPNETEQHGTPGIAQGQDESAPAPQLGEGDALADLMARRLTIPVEGVTAEELIPSFHDARGTRGHEAIDIIAPRGRPVLAAEDGKIAKLFTSAAGGLTIYQFDPSERFVYYYAHLDTYAADLKEGDPVTRGQLLGLVGSTGNAAAAGPHLHFAILELTPEKRWWKGEALDPYPVLTGKPE
jgi:murein DD-endopeptidase MepM/ murein hydrolase activator NlpD